LTTRRFSPAFQRCERRSTCFRRRPGFLGFSYGFRPGRGAHDALDALDVGLVSKKVNWVLDADIRGFLDAIDHEWLVKFLEHRIADRRFLRLVRKWLRAGVLEDGQWRATGWPVSAWRCIPA